MRLLVALIVAALAATVTHAIVIVPQAHGLSIPLTTFKEERCVFAEARGPGDRFYVHVMSRTGGTTFDFEVRGPDSSTVFLATHGEIDPSIRVYFEAKMGGEHAFCVVNGYEAKVVMVSVAVLSKRRADKTKTMNPLLKVLAKAEAGLVGLAEDQVYMRMREREHRETLESNNTRVAIRGTVELIVMLAMSVGQVFLLKRLFKAKSRSV